MAEKSLTKCALSPVKTSAYLALLCASQFLSNASAQEAGNASIKLGETRVIPELRLDYVSIDNTFNTANSPIEATGVILSPSVEWQADRRLLQLSASYSGAFGSYSESILDFNDHNLAFRVDAAPGVRHRAFGEFSVTKTHEDLGTGQATFVENPTEQVVSTRVKLRTRYTFGVPSAKGNAGGGVDIGTQIFNDVGTITDGDDNSEITPYVFFSYRLSPDTRLVTQVNFKLTDYDQDRRDRTEIGFLAGLELTATARTGGSVKFGVSRANFKAAGISDTSQLISDVNLYFKPRSYSRFDLVFNRSFLTVDEDATGSGASLVNDARLSWRHEWTSRFSTLASLKSNQVERNCPNNDSVNNTAGLELNVKVRRWLTLGAGVSSVSRSTDLCDTTIPADEFDTDRTTIGVHIIGSL